MNLRRFKASVRLEAVLDRAATPRRVNLFDMAAKVADIHPLGEGEARLDGPAYPEAVRSDAVGITR